MNWIDCRERMPEEYIRKSPFPDRPDFKASEVVLAWDSMSGVRLDWTRNGKWVSESELGYKGRVIHNIIAWIPIPEFDIEEKKD